MTALVASNVNADSNNAPNVETAPSANHQSTDQAPAVAEQAASEASTDQVDSSATSEDAVAHDLANACKLLSDETRLRILRFLTETEELNVRTLCELLGQSQPAVSHHLALMREFGMIASRRQGKNNFYRILPERIEGVQTTINQLFLSRLADKAEEAPVRLPR